MVVHHREVVAFRVQGSAVELPVGVPVPAFGDLAQWHGRTSQQGERPRARPLAALPEGLVAPLRGPSGALGSTARDSGLLRPLPDAPQSVTAALPATG